MDRNDFVEILNLMNNRGLSMVHYIQIEYKNGDFHNGFFYKINRDSIPPVITFCERECKTGSDPYHIIDWNNLKTLVIKMHNEEEERIYHN